MRIPKDWNDITIEQFVAWNKLRDEEAETPEDIIKLQLKRVCAATGCTLDEARKLTPKDLFKIAIVMNKPFTKFLLKRFKLNGINYEVISKPHRLPSGKLEQMAADARVLNTGRVTAALNTKGDLNRIHQVLFSVCRPIKLTWLGWKPYEFEPHEIESRITDFKKLPMSIAWPIHFFFTNLSTACSNLALDYLIKTGQEIREQLSEFDLQKDSAGL